MVADDDGLSVSAASTGLGWVNNRSSSDRADRSLTRLSRPEEAGGDSSPLACAKPCLFRVFQKKIACAESVKKEKSEGLARYARAVTDYVCY